METSAPITLFVYNRPELTLQTLEALSQNPEAATSLLYIFCDGPKPGADALQIGKINKVREIIRQKQWCGEVKIIESDKNKGLANSIIEGVTKVVNKHGRIIVLEDDLVVSPYFLKYMHSALEMYEDEEKALAIHGYLYPVKLPQGMSNSTFFIRDPGCWGWATWKRAWKLFEPNSKKLYDLIRLKELRKEFNYWGDFPFMRMLRKQMNGKVDSWAVRWRAVAYLHDKYTLYPTASLVQNEGLGPDATHTQTALNAQNPYAVELSDVPVGVEKIPVKNNLEMEKIYGRFLRKSAGMDIFSKVKKRIRVNHK